MSTIKQDRQTAKELIAQREDLQEQLETIITELSGEENTITKKKIVEMNLQYEKLKSEKSQFEKEIDELENQYSEKENEMNLQGEKIASTRQNKIKNFFEYLKTEKWFYFTRKDIVFNKHDGFLWQDIEGEPVQTIQKTDGKTEHLTYAENVNFGGMTGWQVALAEEFTNKPNYKLTDGLFWTRNGEKRQTYSSRYCYYYCNDKGEVEDSYYQATFYCLLNNPKFTNKAAGFNKPSKNYETEIALLDFFKEQNWIPNFKNTEHNEIFKSYTKQKELLSRIGLLEKELLSLGFDGTKLKRKKKKTNRGYKQLESAERIKLTPYKFYLTVYDLIDEKLEEITEIEESVKDEKAVKTKLNLNFSKIFNDEEKKIFTERANIIEKVKPNLTSTTKQLKDIRKNAEEIETAISNIQKDSGIDKLSHLADLENRKLPSIALIQDIIEKIMLELESQIELSEEKNTEALTSHYNQFLKELEKEINDTQKSFKEIGKKNSIDDEIVTNMIEEIRRYFVANIEDAYNKQIEDYVSNKIIDFETFDKVIKELKQQKKNIISYYQKNMITHKMKQNKKESDILAILDKSEKIITGILKEK